MTGSAVRVAIVGPESCGKTTLALFLQERLRSCGVRTLLVEEYARAYYADRPYCPEPQDVLAIACGQMAAEQEALALRPDVLLCDSTVLTCKIWAEVAFGAADAALLQLYCPHAYDLILLATPDIPWVADPLRSHENGRDALFARYQAALATDAVAWIGISGSRENRQQQAWLGLRSVLPRLPKF
jgi:nicotinamide riboside kinase